MEQKRIPIKGINRSFDDGISDDGCCIELINARIRNGSVEPIGAPSEIIELPEGANRVYFHTQAQRYLIIYQNGAVEAYYSKNYKWAQNLSNELNSPGRIEFIGNMAIFFYPSTTRYCIFREGTYCYLGEKPEVPLFSCTPNGRVFNVSPETKFLVGRDSDGYSTDEFYGSLSYALSGLYDNCIDTANKQGYFFGSLLIMAALRMSDGSYCSFSPIMLLEAANDLSHSFKCGQSNTQRTSTLGRLNPLEYCYTDPTNDTKRYARSEAAIYAMTPNLRMGSISNGLKAWNEIITAIDVFIAPFSFCQKRNVKYRTGIEYSKYIDYHGSDQKEAEIIDNATLFYKYAEYNLNGEKQWMLEDVSTDSLAVQPRLEFSDIIYPVGATKTYVYNNRLHIADYRQYFWSRFNLNLSDNIYSKGDTDETNVSLYYYIRTDEGEHIVCASGYSQYKHISPYLMYHDNRAYKVLVAWLDSDSKLHGKEFKLTKSKTINLAYYIHKEKTSDIPVRGDANYTSYTLSLSIDLSTFPVITSLPSEKNTYINKKNVMKVSGLYNPVSFPAAQTYSISSASIVGFCSNTQALSQGQFGQHPLYVFSKDGIYAMNVDTSGAVVYTSQVPVSRDVCINEQTIRGIDSTVLFATEQGLMAISGNGVKRLSADLEGYLPSCFSSSPLLTKVAGVAQLSKCISKAEFRDYLNSSTTVNVAYIYGSREIVVSNAAYPYSYLYNIESSTWSKVSYTILYLTNSYPNTYAILRHTDGTLHLKNLHNPHRTVSKILILTKPLKMGTNSHKRVLQSALRALLHPAQSDLYFRGEPVMFRDENVDIFSNIGLYILGSNDAEHFELLHGRESIHDVRDLVTKMNKTRAYKYFMIALAGGVRTDVSINYMEFLIDDAYTNRLR